MRLRRTETQNEYERVIDDYITQGYAVQNRGQHSAVLKKKSYGGVGTHIVVALLTAWWTFFLGNALYAWYANYSADKVTVKLSDQDASAG